MNGTSTATRTARHVGGFTNDAPVICVEELTKDYGDGRGVFDLNLAIKPGEVFGYVGMNGAGKTTTIRNLMGFVRPDAGYATILGMNTWRNASRIMNYVSYIPGEIAFPNLATGTAFLKSQAEFLGVHDLAYLNHVIKLLELDPSANLKRMSKGMKQKTAIAAALMGDKEILILDEPTTGLDPLMREVFIDLMQTEKKKGRTIFMSSHIFDEIEEICDRAAVIRDGHIEEIIDLHELKHGNAKTFYITFATAEEKRRFATLWDHDAHPRDRAASATGAPGRAAGIMNGGAQGDDRTYIADVSVDETGALIHALKGFDVSSIREEHLSLEERFNMIYAKGA